MHGASWCDLLALRTGRTGGGRSRARLTHAHSVLAESHAAARAIIAGLSSRVTIHGSGRYPEDGDWTVRELRTDFTFSDPTAIWVMTAEELLAYLLTAITDWGDGSFIYICTDGWTYVDRRM